MVKNQDFSNPLQSDTFVKLKKGIKNERKKKFKKRERLYNSSLVLGRDYQNISNLHIKLCILLR